MSNAPKLKQKLTASKLAFEIVQMSDTARSALVKIK